MHENLWKVTLGGCERQRKSEYDEDVLYEMHKKSIKLYIKPKFGNSFCIHLIFTMLYR